MPESTDHELLAEFARSGSDAVFAQLVARYVNLVYSTALRFTSNTHHAEEITQAVFIILARKAGKLPACTVLSGWLYQAARLTAANFVKSEVRRQKREQEAYMQSIASEPPTAWEEIAPLLDEAMGRLGHADRDAIVLRYFENKTARETGATLKITEAAAHKRVTRALDKLRKLFAKRGVALSATLISGAVTAHTVQAAPEMLAAKVATASAAKAPVAAAVAPLVQATMKTMAWLKFKFAAGVCAAALLAGSVTVTAVVMTQKEQSKSAVEYCKQGEAKIEVANTDREEDWDGALADFNHAIALDPHYSHAYTMRALVKYQKQDRDGALADYNRAIELDPTDGDPYEGRARVEWGSSPESAKAALADFDRGIALKPTGFSIYLNRAFLKKSMGDIKGAIADLSRALELLPAENANMTLNIQNDLAWFHLLNREPKEAITHALKACERASKPDAGDDTFGKANLAHAYLLDGQYDKARELYLEIQTKSPAVVKQALDQLHWLQKQGITSPDMTKIETLLNSDLKKDDSQ